eukprot:gene227-245_t
MNKPKLSAHDINDLDFRRDIDPNSVYELTSLLGEGSYGAVYRAHSRSSHANNTNNTDVAIKIIPDADDDLTALWREIRFLQVLRSPFVVSFIESLLYDNELWLVMELCDGGSLYDLKEAMKTSFKEIELKAIISFCVLGLAHLHAQMSIHRDVKSGNVLLTRDGRAKLGDFGISAQLTNTMMKRRTVIGSPYWMAPEVIQETSYDGKADIWSLGITLLELCEGSPPHFNVHPMRAIFIISSKAAPTLKEPEKWSSEMIDFVGKCLVKDCDQRSTAADLLQHPWIKKVVKEIGSSGRGLPILEQLVNENWDGMERIRTTKYKVSDGVSEGNSKPSSGVDATLPTRLGNDDNAATIRHAIPTTRQQLRNATLKKSGYGGFDMGDGDNNGTFIVSKASGSSSRAAYLPEPDGTFRRVDDTVRRGTPVRELESKDESQMGTLKRTVNNNMNFDIPMVDNGNNTRPNSVSRNAGESKDSGKEHISAALRYFRDEPLPNPPEPKPVHQVRESKLHKRTDSPPTPSAVPIHPPGKELQAEAAILDELAVLDNRAVHHEELKKNILRQLSSLKKQYREDLETLTKSYELKRKVLKDALLALGELAGGDINSPERRDSKA